MLKNYLHRTTFNFSVSVLFSENLEAECNSDSKLYVDGNITLEFNFTQNQTYTPTKTQSFVIPYTG